MLWCCFMMAASSSTCSIGHGRPGRAAARGDLAEGQGWEGVRARPDTREDWRRQGITHRPHGQAGGGQGDCAWHVATPGILSSGHSSATRAFPGPRSHADVNTGSSALDQPARPQPLATLPRECPLGSRGFPAQPCCALARDSDGQVTKGPSWPAPSPPLLPSPSPSLSGLKCQCPGSQARASPLQTCVRQARLWVVGKAAMGRTQHPPLVSTGRKKPHGLVPRHTLLQRGDGGGGGRARVRASTRAPALWGLCSLGPCDGPLRKEGWWADECEMDGWRWTDGWVAGGWWTDGLTDG